MTDIILIKLLGMELRGVSWASYVLGRNYSCVASMSKARKLGWTGYADTWDEFEHTFQELEKVRMLSPLWT